MIHGSIFIHANISQNRGLRMEEPSQIGIGGWPAVILRFFSPSESGFQFSWFHCVWKLVSKAKSFPRQRSTFLQL